jgi:hypothetical protein
MVRKMKFGSTIDYSDTMYPTVAHLVEENVFKTDKYTSVYGYVFHGDAKFSDGIKARAGQFFSHWCHGHEDVIVAGKAALFMRYGYKCQNIVGGPLESAGRLSYIDGCSDTLLIYPPRLGDPSISALYFPPGIHQTAHVHPSIRLGAIVSGQGYSIVYGRGESSVSHSLTPGLIWGIDAQEKHNFVTTEQGMIVIAYHPDGDWGPTDHDHTMINRTYIKK